MAGQQNDCSFNLSETTSLQHQQSHATQPKQEESEASNPATKRIKDCLTTLTQKIVQLEIRNPKGIERATELNNFYRELSEIETLIGMWS